MLPFCLFDHGSSLGSLNCIKMNCILNFLLFGTVDLKSSTQGRWVMKTDVQYRYDFFSEGYSFNFELWAIN